MNASHSRSLPSSGHSVIVGFGLPGRAIADAHRSAGLDFVVIEANEEVVTRCQGTGITIQHGDAREPGVLERADVRSARLVAVMVPSEDIALEVVKAVRAVNAAAYILARTHYTSAGVRAIQAGADEVVASEQVVAVASARQVSDILAKR